MIKASYAKSRTDRANELTDHALKGYLLPLMKKHILKAADEGYNRVAVNNIASEMMKQGRDYSFEEVVITIKDIADDYGYYISYVPETMIAWDHL